MINVGKEIYFLKDGKALSDAVHEAVATVCEVIKEHHNYDGAPDTITIRKNFNGEAISFLRFFGADFKKDNDEISKDNICSLYDLVGYSSANRPSNEEMIALSLSTGSPKRSTIKKSFYGGIKLGLQLVFVRLWKERALILPYDFEPPRCEFIFEEKFRPLFFSPVSSSVRAQNSRFNSSLKFKDLSEQRMCDSRSVCWLKLILATSWYEAKDLELVEICEVRDLNLNKTNGFTNCKLQIHLLTHIFIKHLGTGVGFTVKEFEEEQLKFYMSINNQKEANATREKLGVELVYSELTSEYQKYRKHGITKKESSKGERLSNQKERQADKLKGAIKEIYNSFPTATEHEILKSLMSLTMTHMGNKGQIFEEVYVDTIPEQYHEDVKYWLGIQSLYAEKKSYENSTQLNVTMGLFFSYLFIYLPFWYSKNQLLASLPDFPSTLNKLNCEIFINRWTGQADKLPLDFIRLIELYAEIKGWSNNTHHGNLTPMVVFLRWCENRKRRLPDADDFENLLENDDLPSYNAYKQSRKTPLSRRVFKMFTRFCHALHDFQTQIEAKVQAGELNPALFGGHGSCVNFVDETPVNKSTRPSRHLRSRAVQPIDFCLKDYGLDLPVVSFEDEGGKQYSINSFYRFFYYNTYLVGDEKKALVYPGDIRVCLLAMNTGIRAMHLRWLDLDMFDMRINPKMLDDYLHPLTVNTDKVKTQPWVATVSALTVSLCLEQKAWRKEVSNESFNKNIFYNGNKKSKFGAFRPLFACYPDSGSTTTNVDDCFLSLLLSFELFLKDHGFDEEPMYKIRPVGQKYHEEPNPEVVKVELTKDGLEHIKITYAKRTTVHACRNSVVKEKTRYLPESIVGKHITGQHPRLVAYYNLRDPEDHYADQNRQWISEPGAPNVNIPMSDEAFNREMPSNAFGSSMHQGISKDPKQAIDAYGLISIQLITDENGNLKDGVSMLRGKEKCKLACNPTHFCPFDNICPKDIVEELGDVKACAVCPYAISGINHLPAISAAHDACIEEFVDAREKLSMLQQDKSTDLEMISEVQAIVDRKSLYASGWKYRQSELLAKLDDIKNGFETGAFTVGKPEFIANMLKPTFFKEEEHQGDYILKRLRDCKAFPLLETKKIAAKFEMSKRKLMAIKDPKSALTFDVSLAPVKELFSLIQSYKELHGISNEQVRQMLNLTPQHLMESLTNGLGLKFESEVNDD
ncbi:hypothetical protein [uncultured Paraglaciecola sp.]|uniref:hypothetical protein n=1 Tax=uncultured Paraglaciecola sp. TaxID=1765024 RepID=UPI002610CED8|nr:hypothetical protein [uncultured Paraglaciecola sp.]